MNRVKKVVVVASIALYGLFLVVILFGNHIYLRDSSRYNLQNHVNVKPFEEISRYIEAIDTGALPMDTIAANLVGNFVLFIPLIILLMLGFEIFKKWYVALPVLGVVICCVEYLQYVMGRGSCDIDDIILNFSGVMLGFLIMKLVGRKKI